MRLTGCHIESFGKLNQFDCTFGPGVNTLLRENGWGKSTLAAFIRVMLYGFQGESRRREEDRERCRYAPWSGGVYGGTISFETEKGRFRIERTFGVRDRSRDTFALYDEDTNLPSRAYGPQTGTELFGLDADSYARTIFIRQQDLELTEMTSMVREKIAGSDEPPAVSSKEGGGDDYEGAVCLLRAQRNSLSPDRSTGKISRLNAQMAQKEAKISAGRYLQGSLDMTEEELKRLKAARAKRQKEQAAILGSLRTGGDSGAARAWEDRHARRGEAWEGRHAGRGEAWEDRHAGRGEARKDRRKAGGEGRESYPGTRRTCMTLFGILMAVIAVYPVRDLLREGLLSGGRPTRPAVLLLLEAAITLAGMVLIRLSCRPAGGGRKHSDTPSGIRGGEERPDNAGGADGAEMVGEKADRLSYLQSEVDGLSVRILSGERKLEEIRSGLDEVTRLERDLTEDREKLAALQRRYEICGKTLGLLEKAQLQFTSKYLGDIQASFARYCRMITGRGDLFLDAGLNVRLRESGATRGSDSLSDGWRDLIGLARRIAIADAMYGQERPVLILDDPLLRLDDGKTAKAKQFLTEVSGRYQILYLTCSRARA